MRPSTGVASGIAALALLADPTTAFNIDCSHIRAGGVKWDFTALNREFSVQWYRPYKGMEKEKLARTTFDFNVCDELKKPKPCPRGTYICGVKDRMGYDENDVEEAVEEYTIARQDLVGGGHTLDAKWTRLKTDEDSKEEGVTLEVRHEERGEEPNAAIIKFQCSKKKEKRGLGLRDDHEGEGDKKDNKNEDKKDDKDKDKDKDDEEDGDGAQKKFDKEHPELAAKKSISDHKDGTITFVSFESEDRPKDGREMVLRLLWETPHACEGASEDPDLREETGGGWGFFSWFFFLSFMGLLAYFAFFAWINYTRFGKSGFDMLPHADTLRELPHLISEYVGKIFNTLRGGHASGGYSAL